MYKGWDYYISNFLKSPKVQKFYVTFKDYYKSLGFHKWIENKYIKDNNYFNISNLNKKDKKLFSIE
jgi:uncharacterized membrane protein